ncbi:MAG: M14 family zinc carboxypeptidase, partial [Bacteroidota bacterium]
MKNIFFTIILLLLSSTLYSQEDTWLTFFEKSGGVETSRYEETMNFCTRLSDASSWVTFTSFGKSGQGNSLPLLIVDSQGLKTADEVRKSGKAVLLVEACIHPGECEGKDAGITLIRDIVINKKYPGLLDHLTLLFIPIFNVDGFTRFGPYNRINQNGPKEMGWRVNANNLNLNRDFLKAETPEMQAWLKLFNEWMPDFFIDSHTTDGADYQYVITYQMETFGNMDKGLTDWSKSTFIPQMLGKMDEAGFPLFPYIEFRDWH